MNIETHTTQSQFLLQHSRQTPHKQKEVPRRLFGRFSLQKPVILWKTPQYCSQTQIPHMVSLFELMTKHKIPQAVPEVGGQH